MEFPVEFFGQVELYYSFPMDRIELYQLILSFEIPCISPWKCRRREPILKLFSNDTDIMGGSLGHHWEVPTFDPSIMRIVILHSVG